MAQQQERCGAAFDLDGLTLRWYTHRGAAHQVGPSLRRLSVSQFATDDLPVAPLVRADPFESAIFTKPPNRPFHCAVRLSKPCSDRREGQLRLLPEQAQDGLSRFLGSFQGRFQGQAWAPW